MRTKQIYISDTIHGTILISSLENIFFSSSAFNRLHDVSQNSTAYLTFPTNRTKRFEHSLGTMKLCGDMFYHGICNSSDEDIKSFFDDFIKQEKVIIDSITTEKGSEIYSHILDSNNLEGSFLNDFEGLQKNVNNIFYNKFIPGNIKEGYKIHFLILFQAIRLSALLHDIGHPPYSHITENIMKDVFDIVNNKEESERTDREKYFFKIISDKVGNEKLHESMGNKITEKMIQNYYLSQKKELQHHEMYFSVLVFNCVLSILNESNKFFGNLHRLIDGAIDGDRLDYISRDILNSGFKDGIIEYDRLLYSIIMIKKEGAENIYIFASEVKSINTVKNIFERRWRLYRNVIFHHRVAKTDSLLGESIKKLMLDYLEKNDIEEQNGEEKSLPNDISGLWKAIKFLPANARYFDNLSQWNDSWLITVLKKEYFDTYYGKNKEVSYKLEELLSNKKNYYSLIKSKSDFDIIEDSIKSYFKIDVYGNEWLYNYIKESEIGIEVLSLYKKHFYKHKGSLESFIESLNGFFAVFGTNFNFYDFLQEWTQKYIRDFSGIKDQISEVLTIRKPMSTGLEKEPYIVKKGKLYYISEISTIKRVLESETLSPYFFIYIRYKSKNLDNADVIRLLEGLGSFLAEKTEEKIKEISNIKININE